MSYLAKNYNRKKISFKYGRGSYLYSSNGKKYRNVELANRNSGSAALDLAYVASGRFDGFFQEKLNIWDSLKQAESNAGKHTPLLVFKRNRSKIYATIEFERLLELLDEDSKSTQ